MHGNGSGTASACFGAVVGEVGVLYLHSDHSCSDGLSGCALRLSRLTAFFHAAGRWNAHASGVFRKREGFAGTEANDDCTSQEVTVQQ